MRAAPLSYHVQRQEIGVAFACDRVLRIRRQFCPNPQQVAARRRLCFRGLSLIPRISSFENYVVFPFEYSITHQKTARRHQFSARNSATEPTK
jgi:hypothetical protein